MKRVRRVTPDNKRTDSRSPSWLGGSKLLLHQYRTIGEALSVFEEQSSNPFSRLALSEQQFSEETAFIPVEVLESYLDDLLDLEVPHDLLFLRPTVPLHVRMLFIAAYATIGMLLFVLLQGDLVLFAASLLLVLTVFLFPGWWKASKYGPVRRLSLARALANEINRRRGRTSGPFIPLSQGFQWKQWLSAGGRAEAGAACELWH